MKHYFKKLPVFLYICVALIAYSCAEEKDFVKKQNHEKIKMEDQSFEKLLQLPVFNEAYQRVVKANVKIPNSAMARTALEEQYGFDIVTQVPVRIITTPDKGTYYVMLIERPTKEYLKFENLIINVKDTVVGALIMKYELSKLAEKEVYHDSYSMDIVDTEMTLLEVDGRIIFQSCIDTYVLLCNYCPNSNWSPNHVAQQSCINLNIDLNLVHWQVCTSIDEATGGSSSGPAGATGGAAAGSVYASPLPCIECFADTPCEKLLDLIKDYPNNVVNPFKKALQDNDYAARNIGYEVGQKIRMTGSNFNQLAINDVESTGGCKELKFGNLNNAFNFGFFHSHPKNCGENGLGEMFSGNDNGVFCEMIKHHNYGNPTYPDGTPVNPNNFVLTVASEFGTFAIKINDFETFKNKAIEILNNKKSFKDFDKIYSDGVPEDTESEFKKVLGLLKTLNNIFGNSLSVYKAQNNFTGWNKLVLNENKDNYNGNLPCNN
jgi:hypothetical protein